jgi:hypothetical protein
MKPKDVKPWRKNNKNFVEEGKNKKFAEELMKDVKMSSEHTKLLKQHQGDF